jgi:signal peptidase I
MTTESAASWAPPRPSRPPRPRRAGRIVFWTVFAVVAVILVSCVAGFLLTFKGYTVSSGPMENTLRVGDHASVERGQDVRRGDIVAFEIPPGTDSGTG